MKSVEARRVVRTYNRVAQVLIEFEMLYHQAWVKALDVVQDGKIFNFQYCLHEEVGKLSF